MSRNTKNIIVAIPFILLLAAIAIPNFIKSRENISMNACVNNLRWIDKAKTEWAMKNPKATNDTPTWDDLLPYFTFSHPPQFLPKCPSHGVYTIGKIGEPPTCSIGGFGHTLIKD